MNKKNRICSHCKQELPVDSFYYNKKANRYDTLCRKCRRELSRTNRKSSVNKNNKKSRTIITQIEDKNERLLLLLQAKEFVRKSIFRKRFLEKEREYKENFD